MSAVDTASPYSMPTALYPRFPLTPGARSDGWRTNDERTTAPGRIYGKWADGQRTHGGGTTPGRIHGSWTDGTNDGTAPRRIHGRRPATRHVATSSAPPERQRSWPTTQELEGSSTGRDIFDVGMGTEGLVWRVQGYHLCNVTL